MLELGSERKTAANAQIDKNERKKNEPFRI